ncbi:ty3-gypsy retrotransposon protein [Cucumis melo var. makuwa]|uniref:Ty3-gypsy retrotransposon protein n=1 Tax=Cucumis melo var. makuwa TaxID=1194695 RepID=A0A5A7UG68_CUCMM|nr:ty3-gypsy retrotransposon protein [Cucumis melo var. makuwa]
MCHSTFKNSVPWHWIFNKGVEANGNKIQVMMNLPQPNDVTGMRGFLATEAFEQTALILVPVLAIPDWSHPSVIETDDSRKGLGAALS